MSAGLTDSDTMFSVRETPWHGLGAVLEEPPATVAEAIEASGLGWSVAKESSDLPIYFIALGFEVDQASETLLGCQLLHVRSLSAG